MLRFLRKTPPSSLSNSQKSLTAKLVNSHATSGILKSGKEKEISSPFRLPPVRKEFISEKPLKTADLESIGIECGFKRIPFTLQDKIAFYTVKILRVFADMFFRNRYIHRAVVLETVAAVPGMVAGMLIHLKSLRRIQDDGGWIHRLLHEAENERMHLMTWIQLTKPSLFERIIISVVQALFFSVYGFSYIVSPRIAHRIVGYLEEEAIISYTRFLEEIDKGFITNIPAPKIAIEYWNLDLKARLRDVVLAVRADEAAHRDVNHHLSDKLSGDYKVTNHEIIDIQNLPDK